MVVVGFCADSNYKSLLEVALYSFASFNVKSKVYIVKFDDFDETNILNIASIFQIELVISLCKEELPPGVGRYSNAIYGRILLYSMVKEERFIYLDCDIVVNGALKSLYLIDLEVGCIGMREEPESFLCTKQKNKLGVTNYFNSGVIVFSKNDETDSKIKRTYDYLLNNARFLDYPDQDALNYIFSDSVIPIEGRYNYIEQGGSCIDPIIIHFALFKPWTYFNKSFYSYKYYDVISKAKVELDSFNYNVKFTHEVYCCFKRMLQHLGCFDFIQKVYWKYVK